MVVLFVVCSLFGATPSHAQLDPLRPGFNPGGGFGDNLLRNPVVPGVCFCVAPPCPCLGGNGSVTPQFPDPVIPPFTPPPAPRFEPREEINAESRQRLIRTPTPVAGISACFDAIGIPDSATPSTCSESAAQVLAYSGQATLLATDMRIPGRDPVVDLQIKRRHLSGVKQLDLHLGAERALNLV